MNPQVGHAYVVRVRVDKGNGDSTSPVFNNGALFSGEVLPGLVELIVGHLSFPIPYT